MTERDELGEGVAVELPDRKEMERGEGGRRFLSGAICFRAYRLANEGGDPAVRNDRVPGGKYKNCLLITEPLTKTVWSLRPFTPRPPFFNKKGGRGVKGSEDHLRKLADPHSCFFMHFVQLAASQLTD